MKPPAKTASGKRAVRQQERFADKGLRLVGSEDDQTARSASDLAQQLPSPQGVLADLSSQPSQGAARTLQDLYRELAEVVSIAREKLVKLRSLEPAPATATASTGASSGAPERERVIGVHFGITVSLSVDATWRLFYGFINGNFLFPLTTIAGANAWIALALGGGISLPIQKGGRWFADLFANFLPLYLGGAYTYLGFGAGFGITYQGKRIGSNGARTFAAPDPLVLPAFVRVDTAAFYRLNRFVEFAFNVENLFDEVIFVNASVGSNIEVAAPRTMAARITLNF